eukprot:gene7819-10621_t
MATINKQFLDKFFFQIQLLIWKRFKETTKSKWDIVKLILPSISFFVLIILIYNLIKNLFDPDGVEPFLVPLAFWLFIQRMVVQILNEKATRLQESMRMMGLYDSAYWISYFIYDGIITGFVLSFFCAILSTAGLFNNANFGEILGLLFVFCLSAIPFSFFICSFFDTTQTGSQATLGILFGFYIVYVIVFLVGELTISYRAAQKICCLFPPLGLQIASGAFLNSYDGIPTSTIGGILFADIFLYGALAWYFSQVWPSKVGVAKPWYFIFLMNYWFPNTNTLSIDTLVTTNGIELPLPKHAEVENGEGEKIVPTESVNETILGKPTVVVNRLKKTFGSQVAVNNLSFNMYENQIFALLGHNGAGKTTTISMLVGLTSPDYASNDSGATIYGSSIHSNMDSIRNSMGVCPQHDVLFERLTVEEHILFFSQLKGKSFAEAKEEALSLTTMFHLEKRLDHTGGELSGGQKRKLSVAIAVCGGSKFVVLDEPTAGMDPLARRELWDLLASLRKGRTMLLTTHYMDEADILGDRVGIMSLGVMQCLGTTQFLKTTYGAGYKLIFDKLPNTTEEQIANVTSYVKSFIPSATFFTEDGSENQILYSLPFNTVSQFGRFFSSLDDNIAKLNVSNYGVTITSLEDVFLKVGADETVAPDEKTLEGIGARTNDYSPNFLSQLIGIAFRKLMIARNDFVTIPLLLLPTGAAITAAILSETQVISKDVFINDIVVIAIYFAGYLGAAGLIAEFLVRERNDKLRNVLTVMGCDFKAYWVGTFIADYLFMSIPLVITWITWGAAKMPDFYQSKGGLCFFLSMLFTFQLISFSYFWSMIFTNPKSCIAFMPVLVISLVLLPAIVLSIGILIVKAGGLSVNFQVVAGVNLWGIMILSPHGAYVAALLDTAQDFSQFISNFPSVGACIAFMIIESALFLGYSYFQDSQSIAIVSPIKDESYQFSNNDEDVLLEREKTLGSNNVNSDDPLRIEKLRKVFPPKVAGKSAVVACEEVTFKVGKGEIFGLLGANGAGKTTTLSMLTRHLVPTSGDAFITSYSILSEFAKGSTHLGVVTQNNSLWDLLSVEDHLFLFARLRGVPENKVKDIVEGTINQLELTPHRKKLSIRLSGGMKRKLCVAIALIGDPEVVLLDEPSAGLDPVSRRNLWSVILRTMSQRSVILTTHSMEEAEALCKRIGIMVQGQLRALGTKQHLKNKFGSGFELVVKLLTDDIASKTEEFTSFITQKFPTAKLIGENGGLLTYEIVKEEMKMGLAFTELENNKARLSIEDYSVAQPTLEQVFIKTVQKFTDKPDPKIGVATVIGGSARMSMEGLGLVDDDIAQVQDAVVEELNRCGCTNKFIKILAGSFAALFILFFVISIAVARSSRGASAFLFFLAFVSLVVSIVGCNILCCACCQYPKGADE